MARQKDLFYGTVLIKSGPLKGRIGNYDDDTTEFDEGDDFNDESLTGRPRAIVYFGKLSHCQSYNLVPYRSLAPATISDLLSRRMELRNKLEDWGLKDEDPLETYEFTELLWIENELYSRMVQARYHGVKSGKNIFISHSSKDKKFIKWLCADLTHAGHSPWLDEWKIKVGDSIPEQISTGLESCDYVVVVLSESAVNSKWVEREWHTKYWDEIESKKIKVLPIVLEDCKIPTLLKTKKYANFIEDYNQGLEDLLNVLNEKESNQLRNKKNRNQKKKRAKRSPNKPQ